MVGDASVGKTSLVLRYTHGEYQETKSVSFFFKSSNVFCNLFENFLIFELSDLQKQKTNLNKLESRYFH